MGQQEENSEYRAIKLSQHVQTLDTTPEQSIATTRSGLESSYSALLRTAIPRFGTQQLQRW